MRRLFLPGGTQSAGPYELRLPIFLQPLGGVLKNRSAAPASPPCFRRRRWSAPLLFESTLATLYKLPDKTETPVSLQHWSSWWSEATQIRTIALWGIFGGNLIESDGFCAVFVVECNQNFFIIKINGVHECIDKRFPVAFHIRVEFAEPGQPEPNLIFTQPRPSDFSSAIRTSSSFCWASSFSKRNLVELVSTPAWIAFSIFSMPFSTSRICFSSKGSVVFS